MSFPLYIPLIYESYQIPQKVRKSLFHIITLDTEIDCEDDNNEGYCYYTRK